MRSVISPIPAVILLAILVAGCSGGNNPVVPSDEFNGISQGIQQNSYEAGSGVNTHMLWSYHLVYVDPFAPGGPDVEVIPFRVVTDHWNVLTWLQDGPCFDCFKLVNLTPSGTGTLLADIQITHPFTMPNLTGFDVRGIAMFDASMVFPGSGLTYCDRMMGDGELVNADGYTTLYNSTTTGSGPGGLQGYITGKLATVQPPNALLNGYKRHITEFPANTRNAFYAGTANTVTYEIDMPDGAFVFGYAVDASWVTPTTKPVIDPMTDFPPEANCPEPWKIEVIGDPIPGPDETSLSIYVFDWQGSTSHTEPVLECPELFTGTVTASWAEDSPAFTTYQVSVANEELAPLGDYRCLVSVEDNENSTAPEWLNLTAYQLYTVTVAEKITQPPVAIAGADPNPQMVDEQVHFFDDGSYDPDGGDIVTFEWDWDNDGVYDEEGSEVYHTWSDPGTYPVQFRVTDDDAETDELDEPLEIVITIGEGWVYTWTDGTWNWLDETASDGNGNIYACGMESQDGRRGHVCKMDTDGNLQWDLLMEGENMSHFDGIACDDAGNVYVIGYFVGSLDIDPGPGEDLRDAVGGTDMLLIKFDPDGNYLWGETWGGDLDGTSYWYERGHGVAVDEFGSVYACGIFRGTCDFDPGPGVEEYTSNGGELGGFDAFLTKFNTSGEFQWARTWGSPEFGDSGYPDVGETAFGLDTDSAGSVYVIGGFLGTVDFDPGPAVDEYTSVNDIGDVCMLKWNSSGDFVWVRVWEAYGFSDFPGTAQMWGGSYLTISQSDGIYVTGAFDNTVDFDPGPGVDEHDGYGMFLSLFNTSGDFVRVRIWEAPSLLNVVGEGVTTDSDENVYLTGAFEETVDFDPGIGEDLRTSLSWRDGFVLKLDSNGDFVWVRNWGDSTGSDSCEGWGVCTDETDSVYTVGYFRGTVDFDPGPEVHNEQSSDMGSYMLKLLPDGSW